MRTTIFDDISFIMLVVEITLGIVYAKSETITKRILALFMLIIFLSYMLVGAVFMIYGK